MIVEKLKNNVDLYLTNNRINNATYVNVNFVGGRATQTCPQLAHLCEHLIMSNFVIAGKKVANKFMGVHNSDARTRFDHLEFSFSVLTLAELKERFLTISKMINYVDLTPEKIEKEKLIIEEELRSQDSFNAQDLDMFIQSLHSINLKMVKDYMHKNFTAQNLEIGIATNLNVEKIKLLIDDFSSSLPKSKTNNKSINFDFSTKNIELKSLTGEIIKHQSATTTLEFNLPAKLSKKQSIMLDILKYFNNNFRIGIKKPLRHKNQLAYRTKTEVIENDGKKVYSVSVMHKEENADKVLFEMNKWFDRLATLGLTKQEFELAKFNLEMSKRKLPGVVLPVNIRNMMLDYKYNLQQNSDEIMWAELLEANKEDLQNFNSERNEDYIKILNEITLDEFNSFIKKILTLKTSQLLQNN